MIYAARSLVARPQGAERRGRAARLAALVLLAALARAVVSLWSEAWAAAAFAILLAALLLLDRPALRSETNARWRLVPSVGAGLLVALALVIPALIHGAGFRGLAGFPQWAAIAGLVAILEELVIRGRLQPAVTAELGVVPALLVSAGVFALIHLPRYGLAAMPIDVAAGLALAGLREISGRLLPCATAHVAADWAAWFS